MYQLCAVEDLAKHNRWPKPLEHHKKEIGDFVTAAHKEMHKASTKSQTQPANEKPAQSEELLVTLRLLATLLEQVDADRLKWWTLPEKRSQRKRLEEEGDQQKLSALHKINNDVNERLEAMNAKLGQFVRWSLEMNGGVWELMQGDKVDAGDLKKGK